MKNITLTLISVFISINAIGQNISYSISSDDPYDLKRTTIHLDPFYADAYWTNVTMGWGIRANYILDKSLCFGLTFRRAYFDMNAREHIDNSLMYSASGLSKHIHIEPVAYYTLSDQTKRTNMKIVLSSSSYTVGNYRYTNTQYIYVPGTARNIFSARGGVSFINTAIDISEGDGASDFVAEDSKDKTRTFQFGAYGQKQGGNSIYSGYTMMKTAAIFAGLSYKYITNLLVYVEGWGNRRNAGLNDIFLDFMFAPVVSFADMSSADNTVWNIDNKNISRMGWRFGWQYRHPNKTWMSFETAFGARPGYKGKKSGILNPRFFLDITMGISIPTNKF